MNTRTVGHSYETVTMTCMNIKHVTDAELALGIGSIGKC